jgi:hypothetical protein
VGYVHSTGGHVSTFPTETASDGLRAEGYQSNSNTLVEGQVPPPSPGNGCRPIMSCTAARVTDPVAALRQLCRAGRLRDDGRAMAVGRALDVLVDGRAPAATRTLVDPQTFVPVEIVQRCRSSPGALTVTTMIEGALRSRAGRAVAGDASPPPRARADALAVVMNCPEPVHAPRCTP